jgi:hypothetical protein
VSFKTDFCVSLSANVYVYKTHTHIHIKSGTPPHNRLVTISINGYIIIVIYIYIFRSADNVRSFLSDLIIPLDHDLLSPPLSLSLSLSVWHRVERSVLPNKLHWSLFFSTVTFTIYYKHRKRTYVWVCIVWELGEACVRTISAFNIR